MDKIRRKLNFDYSALQGTYWMFFEVAAIFVSVYLLSKGYSNTTIGIVIAVGNVMAVLCQAVLSSISDEKEKVTNINIMKVLTILMLVFTIIVFVTGKNCILLTVCYTMLIIIHTTLHPFVNSFAFDLEKCGEHINYGVARAMGSLGAGVMCFVIGWLVTAFGTDAIPGSGIFMIILIYMSIMKSGYDCKKYSKEEAPQTEGNKNDDNMISMKEFALRNKMFFVIGVGVVALFFGNAVLENFVIQIVRAIGGDTSQMSIIAGVGACLEIPAMLFFDRIKKHYTYETLITVAVVFFIVKVVMFMSAKSLIVIYLAQLNQILGYGLIFPAMVGYIDHIMDEKEAVRGQTVFTAAITIGQVLGMVFGGIIMDVWSVHALLVISTVLTVIGAVTIGVVIRKEKKIPDGIQK